MKTDEKHIGPWKHVENMAGAVEAKTCWGYIENMNRCGLVNPSPADSLVPLVGSNLTAFRHDGNRNRTITY